MASRQHNPLALAGSAFGLLGASAVASGAAVLSWAFYEARHPVIRRYTVPCLAADEEPFSILHLADLHLTGNTQARVDWVRELAALQPDMVVNTGDNLSTVEGVAPLHVALEPFVDLPGAFVLGDHDYHSTVFRLPTRYLLRDPRSLDDPEEELPELPWEEVRDLQTRGGWQDLTNARGVVSVRGRLIELVGVDDPHADRDVFPSQTQTEQGEFMRSASGTPLRLGLTHAPYQRVLNAMLDDGADLVFAGHTHGGQLCVPGMGALVTNCDLDTSRASGLSSWPKDDAAVSVPAGTAERSMFLHVSAGLGTSPFTPVRVACPPEAVLLTLVPVQD